MIYLDDSSSFNNEGNNWFSKRGDNIFIKTMEYQFSCFPCCIHTVLTNLGKQVMNSEIEHEWNNSIESLTGQDLNQKPPLYNKLIDILNHKNDLLLSKRISVIVFGPEMFSLTNINETIAKINDLLLFASDNVGIISSDISGGGHAVLTMKVNGNKFFHYHPNPTPETAFFTMSNEPSLTNYENECLLLKGIESGSIKQWRTGGNFVVVIYAY